MMGTATAARPLAETHRLAERIEQAALADLCAAAPPHLADRLGLRSAWMEGTFAAMAVDDPCIVINRTAGLGVFEPASRELVDSVATFYREAGAGRHFLQHHPDAEPRALGDWIAAAGYRPARRWMKFVRDRTPPPQATSPLAVREIGTGHAADFGRIVAEGFDLTAAGGAMVAALVHRPGWRLYMSFDGDTPAGTGALFVQDDVGWLDWGATTRSQRRKGSQSALLARRIADALDLGCRYLFTTTGEWVVGDLQHSYRNIVRAGFAEGYLRDNYAPA